MNRHFYLVITLVSAFIFFYGCVTIGDMYDKNVPPDESCILVFNIKNKFHGKFDGQTVWWDADVIIPAGEHTLQTTLTKVIESTQVGPNPYFNQAGHFVTPNVIIFYKLYDITVTFDFEAGKHYKITTMVDDAEEPHVYFNESEPGFFDAKRVGNSYISPDLVWPHFEAGWTYSNTFAAGGVIKAGVAVVNNKIDTRIDAVGGFGAGLYFHNLDLPKPLTPEEKKEPISLALPYYFGLTEDFRFKRVILGIGGGAAGRILTGVPKEANPPKLGLTPFIQGTVNFHSHLTPEQVAYQGFYVRAYPLAKNITGAFGLGYSIRFH